VIEIAGRRPRGELAQELGGFGAEMRAEFADLRAELRAMGARLVWWMFVLSVSQTAVLVAVLFAFFRR
jgi:hypothetical protein